MVVFHGHILNPSQGVYEPYCYDGTTPRSDDGENNRTPHVFMRTTCGTEDSNQGTTTRNSAPEASRPCPREKKMSIAQASSTMGQEPRAKGQGPIRCKYPATLHEELSECSSRRPIRRVHGRYLRPIYPPRRCLCGALVSCEERRQHTHAHYSFVYAFLHAC